MRDAAGLNGLAETSIYSTYGLRAVAVSHRGSCAVVQETRIKPAIERPSAKGHFLPNGLGVNKSTISISTKLVEDSLMHGS